MKGCVPDDVSQHIGQRDDAEQAPLPSAAPFVPFSLNDDQPMYSAFIDQLQKRSERIRRRTDDDAWEVWGALVKRLADRQVQRLVGSQPYQCLQS